MSASMQDRTEEATPRKRQEAHRDGQIPRSQELNTAALLLGGALVIQWVGPGVGATVLAVVQHAMAATGASDLEGAGSIRLVQTIGWRVLAGIALFLCSLSVVALGIGGIQARGVLSMKPIEPKWERLNPIPNAQRMFGVQPWAELVKAILKLSVLALAVYGTMRLAWSESVALSQQAPFALVALLRRFAVRILATAGSAYLLVALFDYAYQLWRHEKNLRMTKQEVKQENKDSEGDPLLKARMRSIGRSLARRQMFNEVPRADVVITNPTHLAVALQYDPARADAPVVLAMGERKIAERIKQIALEAGVPLVENRPLARALLASGRVGRTIPAELYIAVAEVLAFVIRERAAAGSGRGHA